MKISFIIPGEGLTGGILVIERHANELVKRGHQVILYAPWCAYNVYRSKSKLKNKYAQFKSTVKELILFGIKKNHDRVALYKICRPWKISNNTVDDADVVIATAWPTAFDVKNLNKSKGKKYYFVQDFEIWDNKKLALQTYSFDFNKIVIANWINEALEKNGCKKGVVINNGISLTEFYNDDKIYIDSKSVKCLMLYHHMEKKGVDDGIKAFEIVKRIYPNIKLSMFGMKIKPKISSYVEYHQHPSHEELVNLYRDSDIFIYPSREEGWGLTPIEAMACKCAVVGTNTGCMLDIGESGKNILLSNPRDVEGLANNLQLLVNNIELRKILSEEGYETVKKLEWRNVFDKFEKEVCISENKNS